MGRVLCCSVVSFLILATNAFGLPIVTNINLNENPKVEFADNILTRLNVLSGNDALCPGSNQWAWSIEYNCNGNLFILSYDNLLNGIIQPMKMTVDNDLGTWKTLDTIVELNEESNTVNDVATAVIYPILRYRHMAFANFAFQKKIPVLQNSFFQGSATSPVPEPATIILLGTGLLTLADIGRRKIKKKVSGPIKKKFPTQIS